MAKRPYMNAVGAINYATVATRPDIAYAVHCLTRHNNNPGESHWKAVKHLMRYLQGTKDLKLTYRPDPTKSRGFTTFSSYTDADFAGNKDNGKSTNGYIIKIGSGTISWASKLQTVVAKS